ncbi:MAG: tRNA (adenosine(37)-N6)-dimethylallyltransferase MiaA [Lachnospiraceae bacterium]|nr:tRNA (adenosine(37)-N6)-dimethylallyltransferase MiaA [Lachnospiraceae bacterium]
MSKKQKVIILTGPTAVGKTELSLKLAKRIGAEIISADSMQVYRYMDIGTAKLKKEEMQSVPHHLIDILEPDEPCNVYRFVQMAKEKMQDIFSRDHHVLIVGGTGFYIRALLYDTDFSETGGDETYRKELEEMALTEGKTALHERLKEIDPVSYETIHENNVKRTIRALEYYHDTGEPISKHNERERQKSSPYDFCYFVLTDDRGKIYAQIDRRVDRMMEQGLLAEVQSLKDMGYTADLLSMQAIGYKELLSYLDGVYTLEEAVRIIKRDSRHYAKRQMTWFKAEKDAVFIDKAAFGYDEERMLEKMSEYIANSTQNE